MHWGNDSLNLLYVCHFPIFYSGFREDLSHSCQRSFDTVVKTWLLNRKGIKDRLDNIGRHAIYTALQENCS